MQGWTKIDVIYVHRVSFGEGSLNLRMERGPSRFGDYRTGYDKEDTDCKSAHLSRRRRIWVSVPNNSEKLSSTCLLHCVKPWWRLRYRICRHQIIRAILYVPQKNLAAARWWCNHGFRWFPSTLPNTWLPFFFFFGATARIGPWPLQYLTSIAVPCSSLPHLLIFISNEESLLMFSSHLSRGLPIGLLWNFPSSNFFFGTWLPLDKQSKQQPTTDKGCVPDWDLGASLWLEILKKRGHLWDLGRDGWRFRQVYK
jgi:hypothetical protein